MRILVDGYNLGLAEGTGVATYGRGFIAAANQLGHQSGVLFGSDGASAGLRSGRLDQLYGVRLGARGPLHKAQRLLGALRSPLGFSAERLTACEDASRGQPEPRLPAGTELWNAAGLYPHAIGGFRWLGSFARLANPGFDLAHWTFPLPIALARAVNIYTIHDLIPLLHPQLTTTAIKPYLRRLQAVAMRADHVITISENSRREIIAHLGLAPDRVTNCGLAHGIRPEVITALQRGSGHGALDRLGLVAGEYLLFFGAIEPKKNVARLIEAYFRSGCQRPLVIAGGEGWLVERELAPLMSRQGTVEAQRVILTGYLPRAELLALAYAARATLFPSLTEGFGLPAVEAMALGTPVIASHAGGLGEAVGEAALTVDPLDIDDIARAISRLDGSDDLRTELAQRGLVQASLFSPGAYAERIGALLRQL